MTFRISTESCEDVPTTIRAAGRLAGDAVDVLMGACDETGPVVTIDLAEVHYADDAGVRALVELRAQRRGLAETAAVSRDAAVGPHPWAMRLEECVCHELAVGVSMTRTLSPWLPALAAAVLVPILGLAQGSDLGERVLALKQSLEKDQAALRKDHGLRRPSSSYKGDEKSHTEKRCYYGADGVLQKVSVARTQADTPGGLRGRKAKRKKEDVTEDTRRWWPFDEDVPPKAATLQTVFQAGRTGGQILEPGRRNRLEFRDYLHPGDVLGVEVNMTNNKILGLQVAMYVDKPEDTVGLTVQFANLVDGTGYRRRFR